MSIPNTGVATRDAGLALRAALATCPHPVEHTEPVTLSTGELVAMLCGVCLDELPIAWGCADCEWVEARRLCDPVPTLLLARPCEVHA